MQANPQPTGDRDEAARKIAAALVERARAAQRIYERFDQARVDEAVLAAGWAIMEPSRNRTLAEMAVRETGLGVVEDKIQKNYR
ncbi:MAG: sulfoacetaldehyde dehydrogenase, partial [Burkholderiaceae bacterium]|nr:sulfoacetaldehyde dehydrogenase [Burkholderiaceae bacterium]